MNKMHIYRFQLETEINSDNNTKRLTTTYTRSTAWLNSLSNETHLFFNAFQQNPNSETNPINFIHLIWIQKLVFLWYHYNFKSYMHIDIWIKSNRSTRFMNSLHVKNRFEQNVQKLGNLIWFYFIISEIQVK